MSEETTTEETAVSGKVGEIIETIGGLTVLELAELVKALYSSCVFIYPPALFLKPWSYAFSEPF